MFLNKVIKRCPAIIFAVRQTDRVVGQIIFLIVSMQTLKDMRG